MKIQPTASTRILPPGTREPKPVCVGKTAAYLRRNGNIQSGPVLRSLSEVPCDFRNFGHGQSAAGFGLHRKFGFIQSALNKNCGYGYLMQALRKAMYEPCHTLHLGHCYAHTFEEYLIYTSVTISYPRKFSPISHKNLAKHASSTSAFDDNTPSSQLCLAALTYLRRYGSTISDSSRICTSKEISHSKRSIEN